MIIGITGLAGVGKDTAADVLVAKFGFVKVALADKMKRICADVFGFTEEQLWGPSKKRNAEDLRLPRPINGPNPPASACLTPRYALQTLGTEWGRNCYEDVWVDYVLRVADDLATRFVFYTPQKGLEPWFGREGRRIQRDVVISDVRFPNELRAIREADGKIWKIIRPGVDTSAEWRGHISENALDPDAPVDEIILNDRSLDEFQTYIVGLASTNYGLEAK